MRRGVGLRSDPAKIKAWQERSRKSLARGPGLEKRGVFARLTELVNRVAMRKTNPKRLKKLRAMQFGMDGKRETVLSLPSCVTGRWGWEGDPMTPSHVLGTRATGAGPEGMVPMLASENDDWDNLPEEKWLEKYGISKEIVREMARELEQAWQACSPEERAAWVGARS